MSARHGPESKSAPISPETEPAPGAFACLNRLARAEWRRLVALLAVSTLVFVWSHALTTPDRWGTPVNYEGDAVQILTWIKAASEGDYYPGLPVRIDRLGAPFGANWNDFPMYEKCLTVLLGLLALPLGVFAAGNAAVLLAHVSAAMSFYLVCRFLRHRWEWSFAGALLFGFAHYNCWRGLQHLLLAFTWTLPPALLCCAIVAKGSRARPGNSSGRFCLAIACVMGVSNPYNLYMYLQLMTFALLAQWLSARRPDNLRIGVMSLGAAIGSFVIVNAGTFIYRFQHGANPAGIVRNYYESEQYGLKLLECVLPPATHNLSLLADLGQAYGGLHKITGEVHSPYLGMAALCGLAWLIVESVARMSSARHRAKPAPQLAQIAWIQAYASIGGVNCLAAFGGLLLFRASNRFSIYISALLLMFLAARLSRWTRRRPRKHSLALAAALTLVGLWDQVPFPEREPEIARHQARLKEDRQFIARLESALPEHSMIFQVPVVSFPEAAPIEGLEPYELLRPYLHSTRLRFSHGSNRGRWQEDWQLVLENASAKELVDQLERFGFAGLLIHRNAFSDRGASLISHLKRVGRTQSITDASGNRTLILLQPQSPAALPAPGEFTPFKAEPELARWDRNEAAARFWSAGDFSLAYEISEPKAGRHRFICELETLSHRNVQIRHNGQVLVEGPLEPGAPVEIDFILQSEPGTNRIEVNAGLADSPATLFEGVALAVGVVNPEIRKVP